MTRQLNDWRNDQWSAKLESLDLEDQSVSRVTKRVMRVPTLSPPWSPRWNRSVEALADNLDTQFQPVTDPSVPAVIEMVDVELGSYFLADVSKHKLTNPEEVQEPIRGLKDIKAPGPNGIPNAILLTHHFPTGWKYARVISLLKPGKDPVAH